MSVGTATLALSTPVRAEAPALQLHPLQYEDTLSAGTVRQGFIEVANPSDTTVALITQVQGFRQTDRNGHLEFYDDAAIAGGIRVDLPKFELGPREAIRVAFNVNPSKLPEGGVYAAIFFQTVPPPQTSSTSYVAESAKIGTLLLLQNGGSGTHQGHVTQLDLPPVQWGSGLKGTAAYTNTGGTGAAGFRPQLEARAGLAGPPAQLTSGLVLPGNTRNFELNLPGSYLGIVPVRVLDRESGRTTTAWVVAVTGGYQWGLPLAVFTLILIIWAVPRRWRAQVRPALRKLAIAVSAVAALWHKRPPQAPQKFAFQQDTNLNHNILIGQTGTAETVNTPEKSNMTTVLTSDEAEPTAQEPIDATVSADTQSPSLERVQVVDEEKLDMSSQSNTNAGPTMPPSSTESSRQDRPPRRVIKRRL